MENLTGYQLQIASVTDIDVIAALEAASFPADEAASPNGLRMRQLEATAYFWTLKAQETQKLVGFVNGTCCTKSFIEEESMSTHDPIGRTLVIHSVTIDPEYRRKGLGSSMLKEYIQRIAKGGSVDLILLLCKAYLLQFYISCGFQLVRQSPVEHGQDIWFEMRLDVKELNCTEQLQVDAFASEPFSGNQAAVVFVHRNEQWMQAVAAENNFAETSFLSELPSDASGESSFYLRWFTPAKEVELCGHATLAAAHALYETMRVPPLQKINFHTKFSGILVAQGQADGTVRMAFPSTAPNAVKLSDEEIFNLTTAFALTKDDILFTGRSLYDILVEVKRDAFANLPDEPNYGIIALLGGRGVIITCEGGARNKSDMSTSSIIDNRQYDFLSRCFFPCYGINEDPVTGSAHCALAPYWFGRFSGIGAKQQLVGYQASTRGGVVNVQLEDDRVLLSGSCVTTMTSKILA